MNTKMLSNMKKNLIKLNFNTLKTIALILVSNMTTKYFFIYQSDFLPNFIIILSVLSSNIISEYSIFIKYAVICSQ